MSLPRLASATVTLTVALLLASCAGEAEDAARTVDQSAEADPDFAAIPAASEPLPLDPASPGLPPNELGEIMVLEYHRLGEPQGEWYRTLENFKADLEQLHAHGFRPITVAQMIDGDIAIPAGMSPVVFTFDDSTLGQFYYLEDGSLDPNTFMGAWEEFRGRHPDWSGGATWCVLPAADYPSNFFGERPRAEVPREEREATIQRKVDFLVEHGHEICNHTLYHARLDRAKDDLQVQEWIGRGEDSIKVYLPDSYRIRTLGLPLGIWPKRKELAWTGEWKGRTYHYDAVLEVAGGPSISPFDREFDRRSIDRTVMVPGALDRQFARYDAHPELRFVNDGKSETITIPGADHLRFDPARWPGRTPVYLEEDDESGGAAVHDVRWDGE